MHNPSGQQAQSGHSHDSISLMLSQIKGISEIWEAVPVPLHYSGFFSSVCHEDQKFPELFALPRNEQTEHKIQWKEFCSDLGTLDPGAWQLWLPVACESHFPT